MYCDTESVFYVQPEEEPRIVETWVCLGPMTSELKSDQYIKEFISGSLKKYAYEFFDRAKGVRRKMVFKVRGIMLNCAVSQFVNFDLINEMVLNAEETATVTVHPTSISNEKALRGITYNQKAGSEDIQGVIF
jgi:hypothetical protein